MKQRVLDYLQRTVLPKTSTEIGVALGKHPNRASAAVLYCLRELVDEGVVEKEKRQKTTLYKIA